MLLTSPEGLDRLPRFRRFVANKEARVGTRQQAPPRGAKQCPHIISRRIVGNVLNAHCVRVVAADSFVRAKPNHLLAIDEDRKHVIRTQRAAGPFEAETLGLSIFETKGAATI